jgi:hypothetical protein
MLQEETCSRAVDIVGLPTQHPHVLLHQFGVTLAADRVPYLHDRLDGLFTNDVVVVLQKSSDDLLEEVAVFLETQGFEEIDDILSNGQLEPPFLVGKTPFHQWNQVLDRVLLAYHLVQLHQTRHHPDTDHLVLVL